KALQKSRKNAPFLAIQSQHSLDGNCHLRMHGRTFAIPNAFRKGGRASLLRSAGPGTALASRFILWAILRVSRPSEHLLSSCAAGNAQSSAAFGRNGADRKTSAEHAWLAALGSLYEHGFVCSFQPHREARGRTWARGLSVSPVLSCHHPGRAALRPRQRYLCHAPERRYRRLFPYPTILLIRGTSIRGPDRSGFVHDGRPLHGH